MPGNVTATAVKGIANVMLEAAGGAQVLLATQAVTATITGFTAPTGSTGMRLWIKIFAWTASGTLTISGTGSPGNTETVTIAAPTLQQTQSAQIATYELVSLNAYTAITNITTTGLTNGMITVYGIQAGKYQIPSVLTSNNPRKTYSPNEHNSFIARDKKILHLPVNATLDWTQDCYADLSLPWCYLMFGAPVITTFPSTPTSLFTAAALTATQSLTTQPSAPGMKLILTVTSFSVAGSITITGTVNGVANVSETIAISANGTLYSSNVYSAVNASGIVNSGTTATLAITGVFGWNLVFTSEQPLYSAAVEWFDGTGSWTHPFVIAQEGDFDIKAEQEGKLTFKSKCQDKLPIGDRTVTPLTGTNRIAALGANLNDLPIVGWQSAIYLDPITGTPQTTSYGSVRELKVSLKVPQEDIFTLNNTQIFSRAYPMKRECLAEGVLDFIDLLQYEQFRQNLKQYLVCQFLGQMIGNNAGSPLYKSWTWTLPIRVDGNFDVTSDPSKGNVQAKAMWRAEYDSGIASAYKLTVITQIPAPIFPN